MTLKDNADIAFCRSYRKCRVWKTNDFVEETLNLIASKDLLTEYLLLHQ